MTPNKSYRIFSMLIYLIFQNTPTTKIFPKSNTSGLLFLRNWRGIIKNSYTERSEKQRESGNTKMLYCGFPMPVLSIGYSEIANRDCLYQPMMIYPLLKHTSWMWDFYADFPYWILSPSGKETDFSRSLKAHSLKTLCY